MKSIQLRKKQRGDLLINVALGLVALSILVTFAAQVLKQIKDEQLANVVVDRIELIHDAAQRHYQNAVISGASPDSITNYPLDTAELILEGFIDECTSVNERNGLCINNTKLPWVDASNNDAVITLNRFLDPSDNYPSFSLSLNLNNAKPIQLRNIIRAKLIEFPNYTEASGIVTIPFARPGTAVSLETLVRRDGSTQMTDDWDFGNHYLDNVKDISFAGLTDRTALTGTVKIGSLVTTGSSGTAVTKPTCPTDYEARIEVAVKGITANGASLPYNLKAVAAWAIQNPSNSGQWLVRYRATGEDVNGNKQYFEEGAVTYYTWCDFA
jgi:hypothetical protein